MRFTRVAASQLKKSKWREATIRDNYKKDTFVAHVCKYFTLYKDLRSNPKLYYMQLYPWLDMKNQFLRFMERLKF